MLSDGEERVCLQCGHRIYSKVLGRDEMDWNERKQLERRGHGPRRGNTGKGWM